jgi:threonine/homoserine/homoserine lactone efflux protein
MPLTPFFVATLALNLAPGPDMTYVAARSLGQGRRAGLISALGISAGCLVHIVAASAGVAVLLRAWPRAYSLIRLAGAAYLLYLGISMWRSAGRGGSLQAIAPATDGEIFRQGAFTNILNPKVAMFFLAFLPQFIDPARGPAGLQTLVLGLMFNVSDPARVARSPCVVSAGERRDSHCAGTAARARAMNASISGAGRAPLSRAISLPPSKTARVGMERMPNR